MVTLATETWPSVTAGSAWPAQWTTAVSGGSVTQDGAGRGVLTTAAAANTYGDNAYLNGITATRDLDLTLDVRFASIALGYFVLGLRSNNAASATTSPTSMYYMQINPNAAAGASMEFGKFVAGTQTRVAQFTFGPAWVANTSQMVRFQAIGNTIQIKWWAPASAEPATWGYTVTDTSLSAATGSVWMAMFSGSTATARSVSLDNLVLTNGAAPATGAGTATGSWSFTGTAAGKRAPKASGTGSWAFAGTATGTRPVVGGKTGTASGSWSFAGTATGKRTPKATGTGTWTFAGASVGEAPSASYPYLPVTATIAPHLGTATLAPVPLGTAALATDGTSTAVLASDGTSTAVIQTT